MRVVRGTQPLLTSLVLVLALLPGLGAATQTEEENAAVALAQETLAGKMRAASEDFRLLAIVPAESIPPGSRCLRSRGFEAGAGWLVRFERGTTSYDVRVAEGRAVVCDVAGARRAPLGPGIVEGGLEAQIESARQDLARRQSTPADEIEVLEAVTVVWRDSSAGCPKKGMGYAQVLTPGARIRLRAGERHYQYHARRGDDPFLCERPSPIEPLAAETS